MPCGWDGKQNLPSPLFSFPLTPSSFLASPPIRISVRLNQLVGLEERCKLPRRARQTQAKRRYRYENEFGAL